MERPHALCGTSFADIEGMRSAMIAALSALAPMFSLLPVPAVGATDGVYVRRSTGELDYFELTSTDGVLGGTYHVVRLDQGARSGVRRRSYRVAGNAMGSHLVLNLSEDATVRSTYRWTARTFWNGIRVQIPRQSGRKAGLAFTRSSPAEIRTLCALLTKDS
jgi:hypothetical protein